MVSSLPARISLTKMVISHFSSRMTTLTEVKGGFWIDKKKIFLSSALLADPQIFADRIRIIWLFDPYWTGNFHYLIHYLIPEGLEATDQIQVRSEESEDRWIRRKAESERKRESPQPRETHLAKLPLHPANPQLRHSSATAVGRHACTRHTSPQSSLGGKAHF